MLDRVGYYCWAGPGTVRVIRVKYFYPRIDVNSLMSSYDYDYLARVKELFGVTDFWATYSWGFSDETEREDHEFLIRRLENFHKLGIRVHAYIQGPNLVYDDFQNRDWWARDEEGRLIPYYRGRRMCSIHDEEYVDYVVKKIEKTHGLGFDGIFVDNIQHGQLGMPVQPGELPFVFCGDYSDQARSHFQRETGMDIPRDLEADLDLTRAYLDFRTRSNTGFVARLADATHRGGMEFGANFFDPKFDPRYIYGIDLKAMEPHMDYILFENHSLPTSDGRKGNGYIDQVIEDYEIDKPVFVVSYDNGVGMAPQFSQEDIDNVFSEAVNSRFALSLKGSEYTTRGIWHNLRLEPLRQPRTDKSLDPSVPVKEKFDILQLLMKSRRLRQFTKRNYNRIFHTAFEWPPARLIVYIAYNLALK